MPNNLLETILNIPEESQEIEFKRLGEEAVVKKTVETVVAMANAFGGVIVLGIDDPEKTKLKGKARIFGINENKDAYDAIGRELMKVIPPVAGVWPPQIIRDEEIGLEIAILRVPKATDGFHSINNNVFVRELKSNRRLSVHEITPFEYAKGFKKADRELVEVDFSLLNTSAYLDWKGSRNLSGEIKDILERTGLAKNDATGELRPTRAAVLLFAEFPTNLLDTKCAIRILHYRGTIETIGEVPNFTGNQKIVNGPLINQIKEASEYVLTLLRSGIKMPETGFVTKYVIPERAIKEAITNAVIHRDYFIKRDVEIKIFEDRVEIENPGLFPYNITPANIGYVRSDGFRNDLIVKCLREFSAPPNLDQSEGVRAMRSEMNAQNLYPPIFFTYPHLKDAIRVVLLNELRQTEWDKVSSYLKENKYLSNEIARDITGIAQRDVMSRILNKWSLQGLLIKIIPSSGYMRGTKYRLPDTSEIIG